MIIPPGMYRELVDLETRVSVKIIAYVSRLITQNKWEELEALIGQEPYCETICFFNKFCELSENIKKMIELMDIVEK
jgi:hypothetical protein